MTSCKMDAIPGKKECAARKFFSKALRFALSPGAFLIFAAASVIAYIAANVLGLCRYMSLVTGTSPQGCGDVLAGEVLAAVYFLLYVLFITVAPALVIGAVVFMILAMKSKV